jgi:2-polyprenyl-3-methyl-5-hydroxy-6-metoxy-1,4-benzoquinol methylase
MTTDNAWRAWGTQDPYFGVISDNRFRRENIDENREEFFAMGARDVDATLQRYRRMFGAVPTGTALDFGSGVGRLSLALAEHFDRVVGLDISPAMLDEAAVNAKARSRENAVFALSDDTLSGAPGQFDFVNSYIVLQHIACTRGMSIIRQLLDKVALGGGCMIHVSVERQVSLARRVAYWSKFHVPLANMLLNAISGRPLRDAAMQMNEYSLARIITMFEAAGMHEMIVVPEIHGGVLTVGIISHKPKASARLEKVREAA